MTGKPRVDYGEHTWLELRQLARRDDIVAVIPAASSTRAETIDDVIAALDWLFTVPSEQPIAAAVWASVWSAR